ncbi:arylesterase [Legionella antarctica]|uniref:Arylesterase n=1 Tax=Legionella antarctica TaxID=2708020 RepID=A0A6F8TA03_9GAMM|nr:arylesterase [Legionella antarctica]BCA96892.1 arylesterase [Legionella antarctica]
MKSLNLFLMLLVLIIAPLQAKNIVVLGDSLSAGYGIDTQKGWVNLLATRLQTEGRFNIINISISGDTTSNGLAKLKPALQKYKPDVVIIELGANDGLRGLPISQIRNNFEVMLQESQKAKAKVLLLGIDLPPNYGLKYREQLKNMYIELAKTHKILLVPMFLEGVAGHDNLMQKDGLHPNEQAQQKILDNVWPHLKAVLETK